MSQKGQSHVHIWCTDDVFPAIQLNFKGLCCGIPLDLMRNVARRRRENVSNRVRIMCGVCLHLTVAYPEPLQSIEGDADGEHTKIGAQRMGCQLDPERQRPGGDVAVIVKGEETKEKGEVWAQCYLDWHASYRMTEEEASGAYFLRVCRKGNKAATIKGERLPISALVNTEWLLRAQRS